MTDQVVALAAIRFRDGDRIDEILEKAVGAARSRGYPVAGYLQRETPDGPGCCSVTHLEDIACGARFRITQALGPGSKGCRLDPQALAGASGRLIEAVGQNVDLIVLNRFGKGESDGQGFRSVIEKACALEVPVLTAVRHAYEPAWTEFAGDFGTFLEADTDAAVRWTLEAIERRKQSRPAA